MHSKKYRVICGLCRASRQVGIIESNGSVLIDWQDNNPNPQEAKIISGRKRLDGNWGWQCVCGNDQLLTKQENETVTDKTNPDPAEIDKVVKNLVPEKVNFVMEAI